MLLCNKYLSAIILVYVVSEGGDIGLFITLVPKVFLIHWLINIGDFYLDWLVHLVECSNVSTSNCNVRRCNFVYHHLGCTLIYQPLSYPFRSQMLDAWLGIRYTKPVDKGFITRATVFLAFESFIQQNCRRLFQY